MRPTRSENPDPQQESALVVSIPQVRKRTRPVSPQSEAIKAQHEFPRSMRSGDALFETWKDAYATAYGDVPGAGCVTWTKAEMAMAVTQLAKPFKGTAPELHDFIGWIVRNWAIVIVDQFGWTRRERPPELPMLRFVLAFKHKFIAAYDRRSVDRYLASLSGHEKAIREGMLKGGLTHEQIMLQLAERRARQDLREEIEKGRAEVSHQRRAVQAERDGLNRERRELERRMSETMRKAKELPTVPAISTTARDVSDEELAQSVGLIAKMMEVDPNGG